MLCALLHSSLLHIDRNLPIHADAPQFVRMDQIFRANLFSPAAKWYNALQTEQSILLEHV